MKRILLILMISIFMLSLVSAFDFDNIKNFDKDIGKYGKYDIRSSIMGIPFLQLGKVAEIELIDNTEVCSNNCEAHKTITIYDRDKLVEDVRFYEKDNNRWKPINFKNYKLYVQTDIIEHNVPDYKYSCEVVGTYANNTDIKQCSTVPFGSHIKQEVIWTEFDSNDKFDAGTYNVKLVGNKKTKQTLDWQIKIAGIWTTEWAVWGPTSGLIFRNITAYYPFDDSSGNPVDATGNFSTEAQNITAYSSPGKIGTALNFTATGNNNGSLVYNATTSIGVNSHPMSLNVWWRSAVAQNSNIGTILSFGNTADADTKIVLRDQSNSVFLELSTDDASTANINPSIPIHNDSWIMLTAVFVNASYRELWVNGVNVGNETTTLGAITIDQFGIGASVDGFIAPSNQFPATGLIDEVGVWDTALNITSIQALYNSGNGVTFTEGTIVQNSPSNNTGSSSSLQTFNCSATISGSVDTIENMSLYTNESGTFELVNITTGLSGQTQTQTWNRSLSDGSYIWGCYVNDSGGGIGFSVNRTITIDTSPPIFAVESPTGLLDFNFVGGNETLNVTFTETNLDSCWFNYNGTNISIEGCLTGIKNSTIFVLEDNNINMTIYANDTSGNENSSFINWSYKVLQNNQTFNSQTTEGNTETFTANLTLLNGLSVGLATLVYNGTNNVGTSTVNGNNTILSVDDVIIPGVDADTNATFFWAIVLSDLTQINLTSNNQTIISLGIDNCSTFTNTIINFTNLDEELQTILSNSTMEIAVNIFSADGNVMVLNISNSYVTNPTAICFNTVLTNDSDYLLNVIVKYSTNDHVIEYYNIVDFVLNNQTANQQVLLFDLNSTDSTDFQLTFTGTDFLPEENVLVFVERQYISENIFKTVELPKTDANGQTILHLVRNDIIYNLRFVKDGQTLGVFENIIAFCDDFTIGRCVIDLSAISNESAFENYDQVTGITYTSPPIYDSGTNIVTFSFTSDDGSTKTVIMRVERRDIFGNQSVCNNTIVSSSGTLFCNIGLNLTDTTLFTIISVDGNDLVFNTVIIDETSFGDIGYAIWFIMTLVLILMASESKNAIILVTFISYIGALSMGWVVGGATGVGSSGIWIIIISAAAIWQINRKRAE